MDPPSGVMITSPLLQRLARAEINLHQLIEIRLKQLGMTALGLRSKVPPELEFNNFMQFYRDERQWCNKDDQLTPRYLAQVLGLNPDQMIEAHKAALEARRARSASHLNRVNLLGSPIRPLKSNDSTPSKIVRFTSYEDRRQAILQRQQIGADIKRLRLQLQWRVVDVADLVGFAPSTISGVEKGEMAMTLENVYKIKDQLQQELDHKKVSTTLLN